MYHYTYECVRKMIMFPDKIRFEDSLRNDTHSIYFEDTLLLKYKSNTTSRRPYMYSYNISLPDRDIKRLIQMKDYCEAMKLRCVGL